MVYTCPRHVSGHVYTIENSVSVETLCEDYRLPGLPAMRQQLADGRHLVGGQTFEHVFHVGVGVT